MTSTVSSATPPMGRAGVRRGRAPRQIVFGSAPPPATRPEGAFVLGDLAGVAVEGKAEAAYAVTQPDSFLPPYQLRGTLGLAMLLDGFTRLAGVFADQGPRGVYTGAEAIMTFTRITTRPDVCTGKPCIRDLRFPVSRLLGLLAAGQSREEILRAYPYLEAADIDEALRYAASLAEDEIIELTG